MLMRRVISRQATINTPITMRYFSTCGVKGQEQQQQQPMVKPRIVQLGPYEVSLEENRQYSWCTCGLSTKQPFCDGKHKGTGYKSLKFKVEEEGTYYLCGCKNSKNAPFCDGAHSQCHELYRQQQLEDEEAAGKQSS